MSEPLLLMEGIEKSFPGVHALSGCRFELRSGEDPIAQVYDRAPVFHMKLHAREFEVVRKQILEGGPSKSPGRRGRMRVPADVQGNCFRAEPAEWAARSGENAWDIKVDFEPRRGAINPKWRIRSIR